MYSLVIFLGLFIIFLYRGFLKREVNNFSSQAEKMRKKLQVLKEEFTSLVEKISQQEERNHNILKLYEINRSLANFLDPQQLIRAFLAELKRIKQIEDVYFAEKEEKKQDYLLFSLGELTPQYLYIKCSEEDLKEQLPYLVSQFRLLIDRANLYKKLEKISLTDSLTHIPNRRYFMERYEDEFRRSEKFKFDLSFLMVDIDHFKNYNDTFGHLVGDVILREVANLLKENIREIDFVGRFGGEEFSIFLPETSKEQAISVSERLREKIAESEIQAYDEKVRLSISIGVATFPEDSRDKGLLIEIADKALYQAKQKGRNRVFAF
ncbi:MAG: GGDEF domain-containing protein [Candidatus Omnitrophica bacterium]|nr:GGDEF domain-containing protein [Candidatus Omnitrophota bacterium]